jgi:hypothetical protein
MITIRNPAASLIVRSQASGVRSSGTVSIIGGMQGPAWEIILQ